MPNLQQTEPTRQNRNAAVLAGLSVGRGPKKSPLPDWHGEDVYIIGGGPSLKTFDFDRLAGLNTIGCNQAFILGADLCNICTWGDLNFWERFKGDLERYSGWVVTNYQRVGAPPEWLIEYERQEFGLSPGGSLAWNQNTGFMSLNLALQMGAERVYLLGFDADFVGSDHHWHDLHIESPNNEVYPRFREASHSVAGGVHDHFRNRQVINLSNGTTKIQSFPIADLTTHFGAL